ncbi:hypothetical protein MAR_013239 [Mya arenaria]|uniref:DDE Tnp4 domain-containing protein n=1 Tax=Mya arenaria TaxID=6604 RepID=A0ABY7FZA0_MYAAR|nr:hypothetical protein MAR_013239 [Mya arenaria]
MLGQDLPHPCDKGTYPGPDPLQREFDQLKADYSSLKIEYQRLICENRDLKDKMENEKFTYKNLSNNAITSLTGLPSVAVFLWLLTLMSGLVKPIGKLCRGDMILIVLMKLRLNLTNIDLAMRGFLISDELAAHGATLAIPPFARGKTQFSQQEVECARRLSKSRIHVERAIERVQRFQILKNTMPISLIRHADSILIICAVLTNLLPRLVN